MNEHDEAIMKRIVKSLEQGLKGPILFDVDSTQFVRMNLVLLRGLLEEKKLSGIFIAVDRPHQYMAHLLRLHRIDINNAIFIDAIGRLSADRKESLGQAGYFDGPFHIDTLPDAIIRKYDGNDDGAGIGEMGFAMIDNLAALLPFNSYASVESFVKTFVSVMASRGNAILPFVVDRERNGLLYETVRSMAVVEISLRPDRIPVAQGTSAKSGREISGVRCLGGGV